MKKTNNNSLKNKYSFSNYKPNHKAKPVDYKGTHYLSKIQCMMMEEITRKELDEYLNNPDNNDDFAGQILADLNNENI